MRFLAPCLLALALASTAAAQVRSSLSLYPASGNKTASAKLTVVIAPGWHISSITQPEGGPLRTTIKIPEDQPFRLAGKISSPPPHTEHSDIFDLEVQMHEGTVEFVLPLENNPEAKGPPAAKLTVEITYQACLRESCRPPETEKVSAYFRKP